MVRIIPILLLVFFLISQVVFAYTLEVKIPGGPEEITNPADYIETVYNFSLAIVGAAALGVLVWGGILWITSAAVDKKAEAKDKIQGALLGLGLVLISVLLFQTINPALLSGDLVEVKIPSSSTTESSEEGTTLLSTGEACTDASEEAANSLCASGTCSGTLIFDTTLQESTFYGECQ